MAEKEKKQRYEGYVTGRPSKYLPEYCDMLIEHMASGLSFLSFAAVIGVAEDTIKEWSNVHDAFSAAKKEGFSRNRLYWEKLTNEGVAGKINNFNSTMAIFQLKNRFPAEWRDRSEIKHNAYIGDIDDDPEKLDADQLEEIAKIARSKKK